MGDRTLRRWALGIITLGGLLVGGVAVGQGVQGRLEVIVEDSSGGRVPGAKVELTQKETGFDRTATTDGSGSYRFEALQPGTYTVIVNKENFGESRKDVVVAVASIPTVRVTIAPAAGQQQVHVEGQQASLATQPIETTSSVMQGTVTAQDLTEVPLASRSFANVAFLVPMTEPVEPSDPTKARVTAVSFGGSSGLNVSLSVDGGDNSDDWIGGFLQSYSPDAVQEFTVQVAQFSADTGQSTGGSVIISTRRGTDLWHGSGAFYYRGTDLNARNQIDNPNPEPKQPFGRQNYVGTIGGPVKRQKLWFFSSFEYVDENASISYSAPNVSQFNALSSLAAMGLVPGVTTIPVPPNVPVPFRDTLWTGRMDWAQTPRSQWFLRGSLERNNTGNNLVQQGSLPSTGAHTYTNYYSIVLGNTYQLGNNWLGVLTLQSNALHLTQDPNSNLGFAYAFPFSSTSLTTSGFETYGDNQFLTPITAFPVLRNQEKDQLRYDVSTTQGKHTVKFGVNFIHEAVFDGALASRAESLYLFPQDPTFYLSNTAAFTQISECNPSNPNNTCPAGTAFFTSAGNGNFAQNVQRLGVYAQDSWRVTRSLTLNYGLRYDTSFGLFEASDRSQLDNPAYLTLKALEIPLATSAPHDYRGAVAPRFGFAYAPGQSGDTVIRGGIGLFYDDLAQNGWAPGLQAVNEPPGVCVNPGDPGCLPSASNGGQGFLIAPGYKTPYGFTWSVGVEHEFSQGWHLDVQYVHTSGDHAFRNYGYEAGYTLCSPLYAGYTGNSSAPCSTNPADMAIQQANVPNVAVYRSDNRSDYNGVSVQVRRSTRRYQFSASYTLSKATTWGAVLGELFDYVNLVSNPLNPFGPGDNGPSGEDVRSRAVFSGIVHLPGGFELSTLTQLESARPFTLTTPADVNGTGNALNDRAVVNGVQLPLDNLRGTPYIQSDLRVSRPFALGEKAVVMPFAEFFNLFNRVNAGANYVTNVAAIGPFGVNSLTNTTAICQNAGCTQSTPITNLNQLKEPAGTLGDFFGPGTTVGIPFAAQLGVRITF
jgi:hypothetical protein